MSNRGNGGKGGRGGNRGPGGKQGAGGAGKPAGGWRATLATILHQHNGAKRDGSVASEATQDKRADVLYASFERIRELNYMLDTVESLRDKHVQALMTDLHARGMSASTLQNTLSVLRTFAEWIGKAGMVQGIEHYLGPGVAERSTIAKEDKSWSAKGIDSAAKIAEVRERDPRVAIQLEMKQEFGLRAREAMQLRPHLADQGSYLAVSHGTKGGRPRTVPIITAAQRDVLERAKALCATRSSSTSDPSMKLHQWKNHFYRVVRSCDISRKNGLTAHGLRYEYANNRYRELSGQESPVRGGTAGDREADQAARLILAAELGHCRESISTHYCGR